MDVEESRRRLLAIQDELERRLGREVQAARETMPDQPEAGELALADELTDESLSLAQTDSATLAQVRAALARIEDGTYGRCVVDGEEIEPQRLKAVPWTPYCLEHQEQHEARNGARLPRL